MAQNPLVYSPLVQFPSALHTAPLHSPLMQSLTATHGAPVVSWLHVPSPLQVPDTQLTLPVQGPPGASRSQALAVHDVEE